MTTGGLRGGSRVEYGGARFAPAQDFSALRGAGPAWAVDDAPWSPPPGPTTRFAGLELGFPFGIPASPLTADARFVEFYARRGFDLLTYKTVRDRAWPPHESPHWAFAVRSPPGAGEAVLAATTRPPGSCRRTSIVNSVGVPSPPPAEWQEDVRRARGALSSGQVLCVSVMGSPELATRESELSEQFADAAALATEAGAQIVELNLSCPNTRTAEPLCALPELAGRIVRRVARRLRAAAPLFVKVSDLPEAIVESVVRECAGSVAGFVAVNTRAVVALSGESASFFPGRPRAGLSGAALKDSGLRTVRLLGELRVEHGYDYVVVGVGGVLEPADFADYVDAGADAVQSCTGVWFNPRLAREIRSEQR